MQTMRKCFIALLVVSFLLWIILLYYAFFRQGTNDGNAGHEAFRKRLNELKKEADALIKTNEILIKELKAQRAKEASDAKSSLLLSALAKQKGEDKNLDKPEDSVTKGVIENPGESLKSNVENTENKNQTYVLGGQINSIKLGENTNNGLPVIAVLVISCNRVTVRRCLDKLIKYRPSAQQFPIIVSQDCGHEQTANVIKSYGNKVIHIQQPDQSDIEVPPREKKFKGYFKIARHYGWALNELFFNLKYDSVIVVEDDLDVAPDFYEYFLGTHFLLKEDPSLWCVSAWNDNGKQELVDVNHPHLLYRTDFFPGLGWMLTKDLWKELSPKWPKAYWDDWIRHPEQRKDRACIRPEVSRTRTFGKIGVSNGLFFEKHLQFIKLNEQFVPFTKMNLTYLLKDNYDLTFVNEVYRSKVITYSDLKSKKVITTDPVRIPYYTRQSYKSTAKMLGLMDDFKSGVPRTGYRGVVTFFYDGKRVYLAPSASWTGYDLSWS